MTAPLLEGTRVRLRPVREEDEAGIRAHASTPGFFDFIPVPPRLREHYGRSDAQAFREDAMESWRAGWPTWIIEHQGQIVGTIRIQPVQWHDAGAVGYGLHPDARGQGLASDALRTILDWCRKTGRALPAAHCHPDNQASMRVLASSGYRAEGEYWFPRDRNL